MNNEKRSYKFLERTAISKYITTGNTIVIFDVKRARYFYIDGEPYYDSPSKLKWLSNLQAMCLHPIVDLQVYVVIE